MLKVIRKTTGTREKADQATGLIVSPTKGIIRVTSPLVDALGLTESSYVSLSLVEDDENNTKSLYLSVEPKAGKGEEQEGAKLSAIGAGLQFSDSASYSHLGGNAENNRLYTVDTEAGQELDGVTYYQLVFAEETPKMARTKSTGQEVEA